MRRIVRQHMQHSLQPSGHDRMGCLNMYPKAPPVASLGLALTSGESSPSRTLKAQTQSQLLADDSECGFKQLDKPSSCNQQLKRKVPGCDWKSALNLQLPTLSALKICRDMNELSFCASKSSGLDSEAGDDDPCTPTVFSVFSTNQPFERCDLKTPPAPRKKRVRNAYYCTPRAIPLHLPSEE